MNYLLLALSGAALLVVLFAVVVCVRTPTLRHRWLWAFFSVFGVVQVFLNDVGSSYAVAAVSVAFLRPELLQSGLASSSAPTVLVPVGALAFIAWRRLRRQRDDA